MATFSSIHRTVFLPFLALGSMVALCACANPPTARSRNAYRLTWVATRASDHSPLIATSMVVTATGRSTTIRTDSTRPTEDHPAFPALTARLYTTKTPGILQLVTRADLLETARNKKGKLKISKRNIGALVPIRAGETQTVSLPSDAVHLEVRFERE